MSRRLPRRHVRALREGATIRAVSPGKFREMMRLYELQGYVEHSVMELFGVGGGPVLSEL